MSSAGDNAASNFPTMIIPRGTEIKINAAGQLSIKTPGNLVIQNSGTYSELESTNGSIRVEENVSVEAVSVRAAQACFIQGTLTAWRVHAKKIALEDRAKAYIMLQESESLELAKSSRLVGNFSNEKEIYLLLGKFTNQLRELPAAVDIHTPAPVEAPKAFAAPVVQPPASTPGGPSRAEELPEPLYQALVTLERELRRPELGPASLEAIREVVYALREANIPRLSTIYREAFSELTVPSDSFRQAFETIDAYFYPPNK